MDVHLHNRISLQVVFLLGIVYFVNAIIPSPPKIVKQPPKDLLLFKVAVDPDEVERPFILECDAVGEPQPTFAWTKNGQPFQWQLYDDRISQALGRGTLIFNHPVDADEGYYQCKATNEFGTALSNSVSVRESKFQPFLKDETTTRVVAEGEPLTLTCTPPTGFPKPTIFWILLAEQGTFHTLNNSRITTDPYGRLHFSNVTSADSNDDKDYACSASIMFRNEYMLGNKVKLQVISAGGPSVQTRHPPLQQYVSPPNIVALHGKPLELHCIFGGTPLPEIQWKKKGGKLPIGRHAFLNYGKTLQLEKIEFDDMGVYDCFASNGVGAAQSRSMSVTVLAAPYWISEPNDTIAAEDEDVEFECKASGDPEPEIKWFVNGVSLNEAPENSRRKSVSSTMIRIERLEKWDTAVYQCNASSTLGYVFKNFYVNVLALPPEIFEPPLPLYEIVDGHTIVLSCRVFGAPKPVVKWIRDGKELTGRRFITLENGDLEIRQARFTDAAHYQCSAVNKFGQVRSASDDGFLEVRERTRITAIPVDYEVPARQSATFRCNAVADSNLTLSIEWLSNGQLIDFDQDPRMFKAADYSLTISKTSELDSGTYTCVARTRLDNVTASATLVVQDIPNPPRMVSVRCERLVANINWQPQGDNRAPITNFKIQFNTSFTPDTWEEYYGAVPFTDRTFSVSMSPWANYTFRVIAHNKIGDSLPSYHSETCHTPPDVPYKNPSDVVGKGTTPRNLVISWTPMPQIEHNAPGFFYRVYYRLDAPNTTWNPPVDIANWQKTMFEVGDQETFQRYRIKVEAHNEMGQANMAAVEIIGYSGEDIPESAPLNFTLVRIINGNTADLSWEPVPRHTVRGHFKGYSIKTWTASETLSQSREMSVGADATQARVEIFVPFTTNNVLMVVCNEAYEGPATPVITFQTPQGVPGPVASFDAVSMGSTGLYLMWRKPLEPNGILTGYKISYAKVEGSRLAPEIAREPAITGPTETRAKLGKLESNTKYRITIRATTIAGEGVPYFIEATTNQFQEVPAKPTFTWFLTPLNEGRMSIKVIWLPDIYRHPGSHFYVQYKKKGERQWMRTNDEEVKDNTVVEDLDLGSLYKMRVVSVDGEYSMASDIQEIETTGIDLPNPPRLMSVRCERLTANINWQPQGDNRVPITNFKIQFNTSFTPDTWEEYYGAIPSTDRTFSVSMSPWANYTFRVIAHNKIGDSFPSYHSEACYTPPDVPYKNPNDVVGKGTSPRNLIISWKPMPLIEHNAHGFFYRVYYRLDVPNAKWNPPVDIANWKKRMYEVGGEETFQRYRIKVEAHNDMGQANVAAVEVIGYSGKDIPNPPRLLSVRCERLTANIKWQPQGDNRAPITNFKIQFNTSFTPDTWEEYYEVVPSTDHTFSVSMSPWANYTFRVIAHNKIGDSLPSYHSEACHTPPDVPRKNPDNVVGKGTTPRNLIISWTPMLPIEHNAPGFFYRVYYRLDVPNAKWNPPVDIANWKKRMYEVGDLETFQQYRIKVEAHNEMGQANVDAVEVIGYSGEDIPNPPRLTSVRCERLTANINWQPQGDNRAPITNFKIQFNTSFTPDTWEDYYEAVPSTDHTFSVSMSPWANYTFRVIAHNKIGDSLPSYQSEACYTPPDVPYKNPSDVVGKGTMPRNLVISWTPMPLIEHNAPGFFYRVYYRLDVPNAKWNPPVDIANWKEKKYEVGDQETSQRYRIKVEAHNEIGQANVAAVEVIGYSGEDGEI